MTGFIPINAETMKGHVPTPITGVTTNTWTDFEGFVIVDDETSGDIFSIGVDTKTFTCLQTGMYHFGGCIHYQDNLGGGFDDLTILSRLYQNGTTEMRCSQRGKNQTLRGSGEDILSYNGTAYLTKGDTVTLQYYTNEANLEFDSNSNFASQIAATLWFSSLGDK